MEEKTYRIIKTLCLLIGVGALIYIGIQLSDIKEHLWDIVRVMANS
ncbi:hypothetical protein [Gottfriedia luciferensis]|jgi:hypothetical protein|nr:hypothetical protein [Gottfriedia luciferensis]